MDSDAQATVEIWTDGGCKPNPGPGGWAAILRYGETERELSGADPATTNNRMELTAAINALEALKRPCRVVLHTDSEYVRNGVTRWVAGWVRNNWRNAAKDPVANMELWQRLLAAAKPHQVEGKWVRGHAGDAMNERADKLATAARKAAFSLAITGSGVPLGAKRPFQPWSWKPGRPASAAVGTSGSERSRVGEEITSPLTLPPWIAPETEAAASQTPSIWPPMRSLRAGAAPR